MHKRFLIGVDRAKMRLFDLEQSAQTNISSMNDSREISIDTITKKGSRDFSGFKV